MRRVTKTEQEKAEIEASERTDRRRGGFELMGVRDRGWGRIKDYAGSREVVMEWHSDAPLEDGVLRTYVPDGKFLIRIPSRYYKGHPKYEKGQVLAFDKEEFMRWLRWV